MSRGRRSWGSIRAVAWLALAIAPACGGSTTAGTRPGSGGGAGEAAGNGGSNVATGSGGSSGATGSGGTSGAAGGGGSSVAIGGHGSGGTHGGGGGGGQITDAGAAGDAHGSFDGGTCTDNASPNPDPNMTAVSGTFSGALAGSICQHGAFAEVQSQSAADGGAPTILFFVQSDVGPGAPQSIRFQSPANATSGLLSAEIGLPSASPGTYAQAASCGDVLVTAYLPVADPSRCANVTPVMYQCPDGCELGGLTTCIGIPPQRTYVALGVSDCALGYPMTPTGSWTLTLTSLTPGSADPINPDILYYIPHGSLIATLPDGDPDGGTSGVSVSLTF